MQPGYIRPGHVGRFLWSHQVIQYCGKLGIDRATRIQRKWWDYWSETNEYNPISFPGKGGILPGTRGLS